jgi:hypothetical protein
MQSELVLAMLSNSSLGYLSGYLQSLPIYIDDLQRDFGLDTYERMMRDPAIISAVGSIATAVLSEGIRILSPINSPSVTSENPDQQAKYERGQEICDFVNRTMEDLQQPLDEVLSEMLGCLSYGHSVAEQTYEPRNGQLILTSLKVKPRQAYAFVVDNYMNLLGFTAAKASTGGILSGMLAMVSPEQIIGREKFFVLSNSPVCGDPRGSSVLRAAYNCWWLKQQSWPNQLKFLAQFGTPSLFYILPEGANEAEVVDANGNVVMEAGVPLTINAEDAGLAKLLAFQSGSAACLQHGSEIGKIEVAGDGEAYIKAIDLYDRQMVRAILMTTRATMEAQFGSKADSGHAQDVVGRITQLLRRKVETAFTRQVIMPLVKYNFGDEVVNEFCPRLALSHVNAEDVVAYGNMISNLKQSEYLDVSQYPEIDASLGLPQRDMQAQMEREAAAAELQRDNAQMLSGAFPTAGGD